MEKHMQNTTVEKKVFQAGSLTDNTNELMKFISEQELHKDQIVSIDINETKTTDGDCAITFVYRTKSNDDSNTATPIAQLTYKNYGTGNDWDGLKAITNDDFEAKKMEVVALAQCAKSVGGKKNQVLFYAPQDKSDHYSVKTMTAPADTNWSAFA